MDDKLKIYELLYQAYADEIRNLWQRSVFLGAFMVLVWTGYGALQLKFIEKGTEISALSSTYHLVSTGLCGVIIVLSLLWIAMAKGSKFVQEAHEEHIKRTKCRLFCDLDKYHKEFIDKLCGNLLFDNSLKAFRYSPSKINIILGQISFWIGSTLIFCHICHYIWCFVDKKIVICSPLSMIYFIALIVLFLFYMVFIINLKDKVTGGLINQINSNKGAKNG